MEGLAKGVTARALNASIEVLRSASNSEVFSASIEKAADICLKSLTDGGKVMLAGNGGSAGDAQHIAGEFLCRLNYDRPALPAIALTTDTSTITAISNDYDFDQVFVRQIAALGKRNDIFIAISTSGNSKNILRALEVAREKKIHTIGFTGKDGGQMASLCDVLIQAPSNNTPLIQQVHITVAHIVCEIIETTMFPNT